MCFLSFLAVVLHLLTTLTRSYFCKKQSSFTYGCWSNDDPLKQGYKLESLLEDDLFYLVPLTKAAASNGAVCLDGSTPAYYFRPGIGDGINKWQIYLEGGGWCAGYEQNVSIASGIHSCTDRAFDGDVHGSSIYDAPYLYDTKGYFNTSQSSNPLMYNWNTVFIKYCDGASFMGNLDNPVPVEYKGETKHIYFRGIRILNGALDDILSNKYNFSDLTDLMITGSSAGGLSVYLLIDYIMDYISLNKTLINYGGMPDSGYFMDYNSSSNYVGAMLWLYNNQNVTNQLYSKCLSQFDSNNKYKCLFAQHVSEYVSTRLFPLQSQYDSWQIPNILGSNSTSIVNEYGHNLTVSMYSTLINRYNNVKNGLFIDSCQHHTYLILWDTLLINNTNAANALYKWYYYNTSDLIWYQNNSYPCNNCCG